MSSAAHLKTGVAALGLALSDERQQQLLGYLALMKKWNRVYNLTAIREEPEMVSHHLLDSLVVLPYLGTEPLLDVGSGAGLPGIPVAIARPDLQVTVLDCNDKKCAFMRQAAAELSLANVSVCFQRVEEWKPSPLFAQIISRAFAELGDFVRKCAHLLAPGGVLLAMKGQLSEEEIAGLPADFEVERVERLSVPGLDAERHLLWIRAK